MPTPTRPEAPRSRVAAGAGWQAELLPPLAYQARFTAASPSIGFTFDPQSGVHALGSDRRTDFHARPHGLAYLPAGCDVYSESAQGGEYLKISFNHPPQALPHGAPPVTGLVDAGAIAAARRLRRLLLQPGGPDMPGCEWLVQQLAQRAGEALSSSKPPPRLAACMTPRRLRQIDELIDARLDDPGLSVADLAAQLGLSDGFFARAFKAAAGLAPHDHLIERRLARARALLRRPGARLVDIALACGFASHAHMTATFQSRLGLAPSVLRSASRRHG